MNSHEFFNELITELNLIKGKRMAVLYNDKGGDFYALLTALPYAESQLAGKEFILLYHSDKHAEMIKWFEDDSYSIKSHRISKDDFNLIYKAEYSVRELYKDSVITWGCGDEKFIEMTNHSSSKYPRDLKRPVFPRVDIIKKYGNIIKPHNSILIIPESNAVKPLPIYFYNFAAEIFRYMGLKVIFNVDPKNSNMYNGECLLVPLSEVVNFANECGYIFSNRTGLIDILCTSTAKMVILSTKYYKPIDQVYSISNEDERIKTIYYDSDPFFQNMLPLNYVQDYFDKINEGLYRLLFKQSEYDVACNMVKPQLAQNVKYRDFMKLLNKGYWTLRDGKIEGFPEITYSYQIKNNKLILYINNFTAEGYRFDYEIYINDKQILVLNDMRSNCLSCPLTQSGEYYIRATLTDLKTYHQEVFETNRLIYLAHIPNALEELSACEDFISYILALKNLQQGLAIFISSRDAHTAAAKSKATKILQLLRSLDLKTDFEGTYRYSYIGVIDEGKVIKESLSPDQSLIYEYMIENNKIYIESSGHNVFHTNKTPIKIEVNGKNCAVNKRGLNFVVFDKKTNKLVDSVVFDIFNGGTAIRKEKHFPAKHRSDSNEYENITVFLRNVYEELMQVKAESKAQKQEIDDLHRENNSLQNEKQELQREVDALKENIGKTFL